MVFVSIETRGLAAFNRQQCITKTPEIPHVNTTIPHWSKSISAISVVRGKEKTVITRVSVIGPIINIHKGCQDRVVFHDVVNLKRSCESINHGCSVLDWSCGGEENTDHFFVCEARLEAEKKARNSGNVWGSHGCSAHLIEGRIDCIQIKWSVGYRTKNIYSRGRDVSANVAKGCTL